MILVDTGPIVAVLDDRDSKHAIALSILGRLPAEPLRTTWPCLTEAMFLLYRNAGFLGQRALWRWIKSEKLVIHDSTREECQRMQASMDKYRDLPMDLADASLVAAYESSRAARIWSFDSDFVVYRTEDGSALEMIN